MSDDARDQPPAVKPPAPADVPQYLIERLEARSPSELEALAEYTEQLAAWKRSARRKKSEQYKERIRELGESADPSDYEGVPDRAYVTIKAGGEAYYWQWRKKTVGDDDEWGYKYIVAVDKDPSS